MNQTLPPGDCGHRSSTLGWAPGCRRLVPGAIRLVWGIEAEAGENAAESRTARRGRSRAGGRREKRGLTLELINALAILALGGLNRAAHLLAEDATDEPPDAVGHPPGRLHDLGQRRTALPFQQGHNSGGLATLSDALCLWLGGFRGRFGGLLGRGRLLGRLGLGGRNRARLFRRLGLRRGFRLRRFAQGLDTHPDPAGGGFGALEALYRLYTGQAVPDFNRALRRPRSGQFRQLLLANKGLGTGAHGCFG